MSIMRYYLCTSLHMEKWEPNLKLQRLPSGYNGDTGVYYLQGSG